MPSTPTPSTPHFTSKPPQSSTKTPSKSWYQALFGSASTELTVEPVESGTDSTEYLRSSKSNEISQQMNVQDGYEGVDGSESQFSTLPSSFSGDTATSCVGSVSRGTSTGRKKNSSERRISFKSTMNPDRKSPWKASTLPKHNSDNKTLGRSSKPYSTRSQNIENTVATKTKMFPVNRKRRRNKYKPSFSMGAHPYRRKKRTGAIDIDVSIVLENARSVMEPSNQKIEADNNFRKNIICRVGSRLIPKDEEGRNGRLPDQKQENMNGKREFVSEDQASAETMHKRRKVGFSERITGNESTPIENLVAVSDPRKMTKRKATPYKTKNFVKNNDDEGNLASRIPIQRDLVKARRPLSETASNNYYDKNEEVFSPFPSATVDTIKKIDNWSKAYERETPRKNLAGNILVSPFLMLQAPVSLSNTPDYSPTPPILQFDQSPLAERQDKTVPDEDEISNCEALQDTKRSKTGTWKCDKCGFENADDETYCQGVVAVDGNVQTHEDKQKCNENRTRKEAIGWGDTNLNVFFKNREGKIRCRSCSVYNEKNARKCVSCNAMLVEENSNAIPNRFSEPKKVDEGGIIGKGGFSLGDVGIGSGNSCGFTFGSKSKATIATVPTSSSVGGFKFSTTVNPPSSLISTPKIAGAFKFITSTPSALSSSTTATGGNDGTIAAPSTGSSLYPASSSSSAIFTTPIPATNSSIDGTKIEGNDATHLFGKFASSSTTKPVLPSTSTATTSKFNSTEKNIKLSDGNSANKYQLSQNNRIKGEDVPATLAKSDQENKDDEKKIDCSVPSNGAQKGGTEQTTASFTTTITDKLTHQYSSFTDNMVTTSSVPAATPEFNTSAPSFGNVTSKETNERSSKKKRRGRDDAPQTSFKSTSSSTSSGMSGNKITSNPSSSGETTSLALAPKPFVFGKTVLESNKQENNNFGSCVFGNSSSESSKLDNTTAPITASAPITFGATSNGSNSNIVSVSVPSFGQNAPSGSGSAPVPVFGSNPGHQTKGPFDSNPTAPVPSSSSLCHYNSTQAPAPAFGSTAPTQLTFGATPAPASISSFGSAPFGSSTATTQASSTFGSTPATTFSNSTPAPGPHQQTFGSRFGSAPGTPAPAQPFGTSNSSGFNTATAFGTTPTPSFGGTMQTPASNTFGSGTTQTPSTSVGFGGSFGQQGQANGFGSTASNIQNGNFSLGTGGTSNKSASRGRRRILKARRPAGR